MKNLCPVLVTIFLLAFIFNIKVAAQSNGDYRTRASGNWNGSSVWQKYNGSSWANTSTAPTNANGVVTVSHNITVTANATASSLVLSSTPVVLNDGVTLVISGDLTMNGGNIKTSASFLSTTSSSLTIGGNLTLNSTASIYSETAALSVATLNVDLKGNFTMNNTSTIHADQGFLASASVNFNFNGTTTQVFSKPGGTISDAINFSVATGSTVDFSTYALTGSSGSFTLNDAGKIIVGNSNPIQVSGTKTFNNNADYEFKGSSTGSVGTTARNVKVNSSSGNVTLSQPLTITGNINFQNGVLITSILNLLTINDDATATGYSNSSFIVGPVLKRGNDDFTFPVGRLGAGLVPIKISNLSMSSDFTAEYKRESPVTILGALISALGLHHVSNCEYWNLNRLGLATANVTLYWNPQSNCNAAAYVNDLTSIVVSHFNGLSWNAFGRDGGTSGTISNGTVTWKNVSSFSPFALGSTSAVNNPLPVTFTDVKAIEKNSGVEIDWSNRTEKDVAVYSIERSFDGINFSTIGDELPKNNLGSKADYSHFDHNPQQGKNYYRIKAIEITGNVVYSKVLRVDIGAQGKEMILYPNPVAGREITVSLFGIHAGSYSFKIINSTGQEVYSRQVSLLQQGSITQTLNLSFAKPGIYTMLVKGDDYYKNKMFIVK